MDTYHKIQTVYKRDPETKFKTLLEGQFSLPEFEYLKDNMWEWSEKINGMCLDTRYDPNFGGSLTFYGKTERSDIPLPLLNNLEKHFYSKFNLCKEIFGDSVVDIFMEGYGLDIHNGGKYRKDQGFVLLDIKIDDWQLKRKDVEDVGQKLDIDVVPIVDRGTLLEMVEFVREGFLSKWGPFYAEGIVGRPVVELKARNGSRIITKLKFKDFKR